MFLRQCLLVELIGAAASGFWVGPVLLGVRLLQEGSEGAALEEVIDDAVVWYGHKSPCRGAGGVICIGASGDSGKDFLGVLAGGEVADAVKALAGDVAEQAPVIGLRVIDLLAVPPAGLAVCLDAVDFVFVEAGRQVWGRLRRRTGRFRSCLERGCQGCLDLPYGYLVEVEGIAH